MFEYAVNILQCILNITAKFEGALFSQAYEQKNKLTS